MKKPKQLIATTAMAMSMLVSSAFANPNDDFGWVLTAKVNEGVEYEAVDQLVAEIMNAARGNTGALVFNFARVGDTLYGYEMFDDTAAFFEHFSRVEPLVPQILELWTPSAIVPTHPLPDEVAQIMGQLGATQPDLAAALIH